MTPRAAASGPPVPPPEPFVYTFHNPLTASQVGGFLALQARLDRAARRFGGYRGQELVWEEREGGPHCTVRIRFDALEQCLAWLDSRIRRQLLNEAEAGIGYRYSSELDRRSFEQWIAARRSPPAPLWKVNLLVWLALYPSVMLLTLTGRSTLGQLPLALNVWIGNAITVALTGWLLVPGLSRLYRPWLEGRSRRWQWIGGGSVAGLLLLSLLLFSRLPV